MSMANTGTTHTMANAETNEVNAPLYLADLEICTPITNDVAELSEKIKTADEGRITGGYNSNKRLDKLRDWVKKESDDYFENDKDKKLKSGWIGEQLRDHVKQNIGKFELNGPIPAQKWFRDEVAKNAPPYANTRGRPKK